MTTILKESLSGDVKEIYQVKTQRSTKYFQGKLYEQVVESYVTYAGGYRTVKYWRLV
jgi:hypothetical protein